MGKITVTLSANGGIAIGIAGKRIWVDALHSRKAVGFSTVSPELLETVLNDPDFQDPDAICYTHCHWDHFSREQTARAMSLWPEAKVFLPERHFPGQILLEGQQPEFSLGDVKLRFLRLPHEGIQYADTLHYGLLILSSEGHVLVSGDCRVAAPELLQALAGVELDVAILDFPWMTLNRGRAFLEQLKAKQILLYHLPFSEDDTNGYRESAAKAAERWPRGNASLLWQPLQTETIVTGS